MKKIKIILPAILCVLIIYITKMSLWYYPLSFGVIIGLVNWKKHKYNSYIGTLLSVIVSFASFWISFFFFGVFSALREFIINNTNYSINESMLVYYLIISAFIIAPILVFTLYKFVFKIPKTKFSLYIIISSIILLILDFMFFWNFQETNNFSEMLPYVIWQFIMALSLQLILYQEEIKALFNKKIN